MKKISRVQIIEGLYDLFLFSLFFFPFSCAESISVQSVSVNNIRRGIPQLAVSSICIPKNTSSTSLMPSSLLHPPPFTTSASSPHLPGEAARRKRNTFGSGNNNGGPGGSGGAGSGGGPSDSGSDVESISSSSSTASLPNRASGEADSGMLHPSSFAPPFYNRPPTVCLHDVPSRYPPTNNTPNSHSRPRPPSLPYSGPHSHLPGPPPPIALTRRPSRPLPESHNRPPAPRQKCQPMNTMASFYTSSPRSRSLST